MRTDRPHRDVAFRDAGRPQAHLRRRREPGARAFDSHDAVRLEPGLANLGLELVGVVEERGREPTVDVSLVAVLAVAEVALDDLAEPGVVVTAEAEAVEERGVARDRDREQDAAAAKHAMRFAERGQPLAPVGEVVERTHQQHRVVALVGFVERARVADVGLEPAVAPGVLDVQGERVDEPGRGDRGRSAQRRRRRARRRRRGRRRR